MLTFSFCIIFPISSLHKIRSENVKRGARNFMCMLVLASLCVHPNLSDIEAVSLQGTSAGNFALERQIPHDCYSTWTQSTEIFVNILTL